MSVSEQTSSASDRLVLVYKNGRVPQARQSGRATKNL